MNFKKTFNLAFLYAGAIGLVVAALAIAIGSQILQSMYTSLTPAGYGTTTNVSIAAMNATAGFMTGMSQLSSFAGVMGIVIAAVVIIGLVTMLGGKKL